MWFIFRCLHAIYISLSTGDLSEERMKKLLEEAQTRTMFNHNHIMELVAIAWWQGELVTIMPRVDFGTVQQYVTKHKQARVARCYCYCVFCIQLYTVERTIDKCAVP